MPSIMNDPRVTRSLRENLTARAREGASRDGLHWSSEPTFGKGKRGTVVYQSGRIASRYGAEATVSVAVHSSGNGGCVHRGTARAGDVRALEKLGLGAGLALKDVQDNDAARREIAVNGLLLQGFKRARRLRLCSLHPKVCSVEVRRAGAGKGEGHVLLPMRTFDTEASGRGRPRTYAELFDLARSVLESLEVMHGMGVVHLDVKPENVLVASDRSRKRYVLSDYDLAAHRDDVLGVLHERSGLLMQGTHGYISPLLIGGRLDTHIKSACRYASANATSARSAVLGAAGLAPPPRTLSAWSDAFVTARDEMMSDATHETARMLERCDLHSLAATVHRLRPSASDLAAPPTAFEVGMTATVVGGLLSGAFPTARLMLKFLASHRVGAAG